jgi:hypothetical protein
VRFRLVCLWLLALLHIPAQAGPASAEMPRIRIGADGHRTLMVDGRPFLVLAAQLHNSSAWPAVLDVSWGEALKMSPNTIEAPVYWEQFEPQPGKFDTRNVDALIAKARATGKRLILLWFGTWKNGENHYTPTWMRSDPARFPRMVDPRGELVDVQSPFSAANLEADKNAYVALLHHLKAVDGNVHTVIMVQVENEPGSLGTVRDHGAAAEALFNAPVPDDLTARLGKAPGSWKQVFGPDADEAFAAWSTARFIEQVAAAGRAVYPLPVYVNCWMRYKGFNKPGLEYPSGGPVWTMFDLWRAVTPSVDMIGTDIYTTDPGEYRRVLDQYHRPDNPSWVSETDFSTHTAPFLYYVLARGGIGFSVFGIDKKAPTPEQVAAMHAHGDNFALLDPVREIVAEAAADHRLYAAVEEPGRARQVLPLADGWSATISFGPPPWGETPAIISNTKSLEGRLFMVRLDRSTWLVGGSSARVELSRTDGKKGQMLRVEEGRYEAGAWQATRWLNGDETDFGLNIDAPGLLRVTVGTL